MALQRGSSGSRVRELQQALVEAGFDPGPIDGVFGPRTEAALRSYQAAQGYEVTGIADVETLGALGLGSEETEDGDGGPGMSLPGNPELWKVGGKDMLVYTVPDSFPPIYMMWEVPDGEDLQSFFGPDQEIVYDQEMSWGEAKRQLGALVFGTTDELANFDDDPFTSWAYMMETEAQSQPWIMEDDYQALIAMAILEGRTLTDAEIQSTNWWRNNSSAQREWMKLYHGDPEEANRRLEDNRALARQVLTDAGLTGFGEELVEFMADQVTMGNWSETYFNTQVSAISDPESTYAIDEALTAFQEGLGTTIEHEDTVTNLVNKWLGPAMGQWSEAEIAEWSGVLRNDPNGEQRLVEMLKNQRMALFPEYEDRNLSYQDIAQPWKNYGFAQWGQQMDETDDMFIQMVKNNDTTLNGQLLRQKGLKQGVGKVVDDANSALLSGTGGSVRRQVQ